MMENSQYDRVSKEKLSEIIQLTRFEAITGRKPGEEDVSHHFRKGISGDWKKYFTSTIKKRFKSQYGDLLIRTKYENTLDW